MDGKGEVEDDQGSGWLEVKKKNRTSSKLSIQKVSGGLTFKTNAYSLHYQAPNNEEVGKFQSNQHPQSIQAGFVAASHPKMSAESHGPPLVKEDESIKLSHKVTPNQENEPPEKLVSTSTRMLSAGGGAKEIQEAPINKRVDDVLKIKWDDLEDESLTMASVGSTIKTKCSDGDCDLQVFPCTPFQEEKPTAESHHGEQFPGGIQSLVLPKESLNGSGKEPNETSMEDVKQVKSISKVYLQNEEDPDEGPTNITTEATDASPETCEGAEIITVQIPHNTHEVGSLDIPEATTIAENEIKQVSLEENNLLECQKCCAEDPVVTSGAAAVEEGSVLQHISVDGPDHGEGVSAESKERFRQRLWCFLFENLNRAVDELYLLCELECDVEQMDEAILVLEEAASDFRELKSRVENFETTKRSPAQSPKNVAAINVKNDHRRPHALSWEVRRMTNSAQRAEILSSSLEAFKKIQHERAGKLLTKDAKGITSADSVSLNISSGVTRSPPGMDDIASNQLGEKSEKQTGVLDSGQERSTARKQNVEAPRPSRTKSAENEHASSESQSTAGRFKREPLEPISETQKQASKKDKLPLENRLDRQAKSLDMGRRSSCPMDKEKEKEKEKQNFAPWKSLNAWKEKRNWEDILKSPMRSSSRVSHSPSLSRKGQERARVLHDKLMSPEKKKKSASHMKREAEEKHARALRIRSQLESERMQRLQRTSEKLNRVNEWHAVRSLKLREGMYARHQRSESRHEAYLAQVVKRAGDESSKVNEVRFITSLNEENKKLILRQKLHDSEVRRAEKLQVIRTKQKEDIAREEAVLERRKLLEAEKLQRLAETQRKKEEAQVRREEERKASSAAREARVMEQLRRKEVRAKAQQEEAELLAQRLAERLRESEHRRKFYLEQIRERASMDFRDQSSPLLRRSSNREGQNRSTLVNNGEDYQTACLSTTGLVCKTQQQTLKRRIKKIRQRLMALKYEFADPPLGSENTGVGYRALLGGARAKIGRWLQELQRLRQARKEGTASIGLIVGDMVKFLEGREPELHAARQAGLLDFVASALPASHTSKPEACHVTVYLLRLLRVVLSLSANRNFFLVQNLLPPIIPMLSASLENYIKIAASSSLGSTNLVSTRTSIENLELITEILDGYLWTVTAIVGHVHVDERQLQMQDGLVELIVAYQVIHRLRDLFALYDRPQVEGAPFPSSILLSLNMLTVLTSRPASISSIDWESATAKTTLSYEAQEAIIAKRTLDLGNSSLIENHFSDNSAIGDLPGSESGQKGGEEFEEKSPSRRLIMADVPDGRLLDAELTKKPIDNLVFSDSAEGMSQYHTSPSSDEPQSIVAEEQVRLPLLQKDLKSSTVDGSDRTGIDDRTVCDNNENKKEGNLKQPIVFLLSSIAETGLVSLPSLLTAVLLQANSRMSLEQSTYVLPLNFEEVAIGVLKVLNNLAFLDITLLQSMLARSDLKMEFFHLMSFLLSHCTNKWRAANDQVGLLLFESLLLLGYFALFHPENQAVLRWGKSPTILHKVCDLPFVFFSDPELTPILAGILVAACYGCEQNRGVVQQELSIDMLLSLLKSCRQGLLSLQYDSSPPDGPAPSDMGDGHNPSLLEAKKAQLDSSVRSNRRSSRVSIGKGGVGSSVRASRAKSQRDNKGLKTCDEWALKQSLRASDASSTFMLHQRFPMTFLDKAEEFFSAGVSPI